MHIYLVNIIIIGRENKLHFGMVNDAYYKEEKSNL